MATEFINPYKVTKLYATVALHPSQMDNKIYLNLKENLNKLIVGRCYKDYGYVTKLSHIENIDNGFVEAEDLDGVAKFKVTFVCTICKPIKNTTIICKIDRVNKLLITAKNGPIVVIITTGDRVNNEKFVRDNNELLRYKKDNKLILLKTDDFIKVTLQSISFHDKEKMIKTIGFLDDLITDDNKDEIEEYYKQMYDDKRQNEIVEVV